ncbi:MAG: hypothetical protein HOB37_14270 [Rhodospirillaceae bacterium]|jgi:hypothetical protein|nr:hypothetical protein [Rhodospirillaceae bacterium]MBT5297030.1 hypothetical protein [Rhodospirillaceae bacterium]MBT5516240.1 hypothetical protein [Rhodospirillaceae bacterium]MBT6085261.1 hypothetical protein [Rhodospirillaceae bacterium]MBT6609607.1 hypothetical protein [Rhodospirillaceae bacterium]
MMKPAQIIAQATVYALFALGIGVLSTRPSYTHFDPARALIKVSFAHGGEPVTACRKRSRAELKALAANMRKASICPRQRVALRFELSLDNTVILSETLPPTGWRGDGSSKIYRRIPTTAGRHTIVAKLRDSRRDQGFDHVSRHTITLVPGQSLSIDFKPAHGGFIYE